MAAAEVLAINKLKGLGCQNDTGGSIELQRLFGALSNQGVEASAGDIPNVRMECSRCGQDSGRLLTG